MRLFLKRSYFVFPVLFSCSSAAGDSLPSGPGLAAKFPGDFGLQEDPGVIQVESFEQKKIAMLAAGWETVKSEKEMSFSPEDRKRRLRHLGQLQRSFGSSFGS